MVSETAAGPPKDIVRNVHSQCLEEFLMRELETKFLQDFPGIHVLRMMTRRQPFRAQRFERIGYYPARCLQRQPSAPILWPQVKSQLVNLVFRPVGPEPAASRKLAVGKQVNRPVLKVVSFHPDDLALQSLVYFLIGKRPA